jgi:hypothetical protein
MTENFELPYEPVKKKGKYAFILNILLFVITFFTTTLSGIAWLNQDPYQLENFTLGLQYSILVLLIITSHEFGHYFAAKYHKIDVTLPYYIPFPFIFLNPFGTMGAVIKMKSPTQTRKSLFDIGIAGPIAGWVVSIAILIYGYLTLPSINYLYNIHPDYATSGIKLTGLTFGNNLTFFIFEKIFSTSGNFIPPMNEVYHYPFLCAGWFGLLITSLNMMPIGQLDGGHISYTMFGKNHKIIANIVFLLLIAFGLMGFLPLLNININLGSVNWLVWAILIYFVIKIEHPPICTDIDVPMGRTRLILGWFSFVIFVTSFCPIPLSEM